MMNVFVKYRALFIIGFVVLALIVIFIATKKTPSSNTPTSSQSQSVMEKIQANNREIIRISKQLRSKIAKPSEEKRIVEIAKHKKNDMAHLIETDPTSAMQVVIRKDDYVILPNSVKSFVEQEGEVTGKILEQHIDNVDNTTSSNYILENNSTSYNLYFAHSIPANFSIRDAIIVGAALDTASPANVSTTSISITQQ